MPRPRPAAGRLRQASTSSSLTPALLWSRSAYSSLSDSKVCGLSGNGLASRGQKKPSPRLELQAMPGQADQHRVAVRRSLKTASSRARMFARVGLRPVVAAAPSKSETTCVAVGPQLLAQFHHVVLGVVQGVELGVVVLLDADQQSVDALPAVGGAASSRAVPRTTSMPDRAQAFANRSHRLDSDGTCVDSKEE